MDNLEGLEDLTSLWTFDEDVDDLKKQLESKTNELAAVKKAAIEQTKQYKDNVKKLIRVLGRAFKERDEAKDKLQKLLLQTNQALAPPLTVGSLSPQSPLITVNNTTVHGSPCSKNNHQADWAIIENLAKGRPRPQQGHLLTAVCEASQLFNSVAKTGSHSVLLPVPQTPPQVADAPQVPATPVRAHKARARPRTACTNSQMLNGSSSAAAAASLSASNCSSLGLTDQIQMPKRQCIYIEID